MSALISDLLPLFSMTGDESSPPIFTSRAKSSLLSSSPLSIGPLHTQETAKRQKDKKEKKKHFPRTGNAIAYARLLQLPGDVSATRYEGGRGPVTQRHLDLTGIHNNGAPRTANENNKKRETKKTERFRK